MDLELVPTKDLIEELMNRTSFAGVLVYSLKENREQNELHEFALKSTCDQDSTILMLSRGLEAVHVI